jgi:hypothetical protein
MFKKPFHNLIDTLNVIKAYVIPVGAAFQPQLNDVVDDIGIF